MKLSLKASISFHCVCSLEWTAGKGVLIILLRWFSNRTGTSVDDGARNQTTSLTNGRAPNWVPEVEFSPFRALSRRQMTFSFCCQITLFLKPQWLLPNSELKQRRRRRRRQRERQKRNRYTLAKQQLCTCITLFCTFVWRHYTISTWNFLISRFLEDVNARRWLSFSFPELRYSLLEFISRKKLPTFDESNEMD